MGPRDRGFAPSEEITRLLRIEEQEFGVSAEASAALREELKTIRRKGFADTVFEPDRYTPAAPILDSTGSPSGGVAIGVNNFEPTQRGLLSRRLTDAVTRASS